MNIRMRSRGPLRLFLSIVLAITVTTAPSAAVMAQGYGAQQAVRQRVQGLEGQPAAPPSQPAGPAVEEPAPQQYDSTPDGIDTTYVAPGAAAIIVFRPAQIMAAPIAKLLPTEVASAAGLQYSGIDPATVDELIGFVDLSGPAGFSYGLTVKFNQPFQGSAIPPHARPYAQLSELAGRKYLQSGHPLFPSFYGTNNRTLIAAPDATLRPLVETLGQPKSGPLLDRVRAASAGHDLYVAVDFAGLRPLIQMGLGMAPAEMPPDAKELLEAPNLLAAAELTLNVSGPGPTSLVLHANDESAAQQLETMFVDLAKQQASPEGEQPGMDDPVAQAMARYRERMSQSFGRQRNGASLTLFHIDGQDPAQQQLVSSAMVLGLSLLAPILEAAGNAAQQPPGAGMESPEAQPGP